MTNSPGFCVYCWCSGYKHSKWCKRPAYQPRRPRKPKTGGK